MSILGAVPLAKLGVSVVPSIFIYFGEERLSFAFSHLLFYHVYANRLNYRHKTQRRRRSKSTHCTRYSHHGRWHYIWSVRSQTRQKYIAHFSLTALLFFFTTLVVSLVSPSYSVPYSPAANQKILCAFNFPPSHAATPTSCSTKKMELSPPHSKRCPKRTQPSSIKRLICPPPTLLGH